jgi:hypothetical protein
MCRVPTISGADYRCQSRRLPSAWLGFSTALGKFVLMCFTSPRVQFLQLLSAAANRKLTTKFQVPAAVINSGGAGTITSTSNTARRSRVRLFDVLK